MENTDCYAAPSRVSIIMPCYNAREFVGEAVASVFNQTYSDVELIVVDDGSADGSLEELQNLAAAMPTGRMKVYSQERGGAFRARNVALRHASGEFIAFLDADDFWAKEFLQSMIEALHSDGADIAYCGWQNFGTGAQGIEPYVPTSYQDVDIVAAFLYSCPWPIHAVLLRRKFIEGVGGFSEARFSAMDYDLWLRALARGPRLVRVPEVMAFYRWHGSGQISSVKWRQVLDALSAQIGFINSNPHLVAHLADPYLYEVTHGRVLEHAYQSLWRRDLASAHKLFRHLAVTRKFGLTDAAHVAVAALPFPLYTRLIALVDRVRGQPTAVKR